MPIQFVKIDVEAGRIATRLRNFIERLKENQEDAAYLKLVTDNMTDGTDNSMIETMCGVPTGKGGALKTQLDGANTALSAAAINNLIRNLG